MYASVHADRTGRVLVSREHAAAGMGGLDAIPIADAIPLPEHARLVPLAREALAFDRTGRLRAEGRERSALGAVLPGGYSRTLFPAYRDDAPAPPVELLPFAAIGADEAGDLVVAATRLGSVARSPDAAASDAAGLLRSFPANALARQLTRCAREHGCHAAGAIGRGDLPVPLGAPLAERPTLPCDLRSGYGAAPLERAALRPSAAEIAEVAAAHLARGGRGVSFGRACDGEPLAVIRVLEAAVRLIRERARGAHVQLETSGSDPTALRRAIYAGCDGVTVRIASARPDIYDRMHGPVAHRWTEVRASLELAAAQAGRLTIAVLVLPGLSDQAAELEALVTLLGTLGGGRLELRDLAADPLRVLAALPRDRVLGMRAFHERIAAEHHFSVRSAAEAGSGLVTPARPS